MPTFDRFDICEAHYLFAADYHSGQTCPLYQKLGQLMRMGFKPRVHLGPGGFSELSENGQDIYNALCRKYGFEEEAVS